MKREVNLYFSFIKCGIVVRYGQIIGSDKTNLQVTGDEKGSTAFIYLLAGL